MEQDAREVVRQVASVLGDVLAQVPRSPGLVALTGQGDGCWLLDGDGAPVRPAVSWLDARAAGIVDDWGRSGLAQELYARTGTAVFPGLQAPVLAWLDRHEPASLDRAATAAYCKDVVLQALTGERAGDRPERRLGDLRGDAGVGCGRLRRQPAGRLRSRPPGGPAGPGPRALYPSAESSTARRRRPDCPWARR